MGLLASWLLFPLLLLAICQGCGVLIQALAGRPLAAGVRLPCGLALVIVVMDVCTRTAATARLAVYAPIALALVGLVLWMARREVGEGPAAMRRMLRASPRARHAIAVAPALIVFAIYAAPIVLSGAATWAGYIKLDDTATWLALVDRALSHGRSIASLPPSTYRAALSYYLTSGYPLGSFLPLGLGHLLTGQDIAWLTDPWMAFIAAMLALSLDHALARAIQSRWRRALVAVLAAQSTLLYGYYLWGGMKELAAAMLVGAFAVSAPLVMEGQRRGRAAIAPLIVVWAVIAADSSGGLAWLGPGALLGVVAALARHRHRLPPKRVLVVAAIAVAGGVYDLLRPGGFAERYRGVLTAGDQLGNLVKPLSIQQLAGIWPNGDFRYPPSQLTITHVLVILVVVGAVLGLVLALWRGYRELALYLLCAVSGALIIHGLASPWVGGKALATASPALPLAALTGASLLRGRRVRVVGALLGLAVAGGIVWSNLLAYNGVSLAPRQQFAELAQIGQRISGQGPTLMTEYQPYGARHFLRGAAPESASELRTRLVPLISGQGLPKGGFADIDQFELGAILTYRTLVLQRSPTASRPPSPYHLIERDRYWDVWQRPARVQPRVIAHLPLGDEIAPGAVPACTDIAALAHRPGVHELVAAPVRNPIVVAASDGNHPASWTNMSYLELSRAGSATIPVAVHSSGLYSVWLGGSMRGAVSISVDGQNAGSARNDLQEAGQYVPFGTVKLHAGVDTVRLTYSPSVWVPGSGGPADLVGPLVLARELPAPPLITVPVHRAGTLCGRTLDWVEAIGS
jgi:hypothetical protein